MMPVKGKDVMLSVWDGDSYIPFICAKEVGISVSPELVNKTTHSSGRGFQYKPRRVDWTMTISGVTTIIGDGETVFKALNIDRIFAGYSVQLLFTDDNGNTAIFLGVVYLEDGNLTGPQEGFSEFDLSFKGSGLYNFTSDTSGEPPEEPVSDNITSDWWVMPEGSNQISGLSAIKGLSLAGVTVLEVDRSGLQYDLVNAAPGNRQARHNSGTGVIDFEVDAYPPGETVFVLIKT